MTITEPSISVSVVTVTYWTGDVLKRCVESLRRQAVDEIILIDNGNPDDVSDWLDLLPKQDSRVRIVRPDRNTGFAAACNLGAAQASGDFVVLVNLINNSNNLKERLVLIVEVEIKQEMEVD